MADRSSIYEKLLGLNQSLYSNKNTVMEDKSIPPSTILAKIQDAKDYASNKFSLKKEREATNEIPSANTKNKQLISNHKRIYFLQIGAFRKEEEAENKKANLALIGFEANISKYQSNSGLLYRVRIGPFSQIKRMDRVLLRLADNSINVAILRTMP